MTGSAIMDEETLTKAERKLIEGGQGAAVRETRRMLQDTMRDEMVTAVEDLTGRRVIGFPRRRLHVSRRPAPRPLAAARLE